MGAWMRLPVKRKDHEGLLRLNIWHMLRLNIARDTLISSVKLFNTTQAILMVGSGFRRTYRSSPESEHGEIFLYDLVLLSLFWPYLDVLRDY